MHVCFHHSEQGKHGTVLSNVQNLLADDTVDLDEVAVVANSDGVKLALADADFSEDVRDLIDREVAVNICGNTLRGSGLDEDDLVDDVDIVSSGVGELTRFQDRGYGTYDPE